MHLHRKTSESNYNKTCLKRPLKKRPKIVFKTDYRLMQVNILRSILQYFHPSLSYHLTLRSLFCLVYEWPLQTGFTVTLYDDTKKALNSQRIFLTHLYRMYFPILINWRSPFKILGFWVVLFIFIYILKETSVSKQRITWSDAAFCGV